MTPAMSFHSQVQSKFHQFLELQKQSDKSIPGVTPLPNTKRSAVLCCLKEDKGEISVLITIRSYKLASQPGHPCLPGGKEEPSDVSIEDTALRETEEEIGLKRDKVTVVGTLPPLIFSRNGLSKCYVVVCTLNVPDPVLTLGTEVHKYYWVPLKLFLGGDHHCTQMQHFNHAIIAVDYFEIVKPSADSSLVIVWGLTGVMCIIVASIVFSSPPRFPCTLYYVDTVDDCNMHLKSFVYPDIFTAKL